MLDWLTPSVDPSALRTWRRWAGAVLLGYLVLRSPALLADGATWEPVGLLRSLDAPLSPWIRVVLLVVAVAGAAHLASGRRPSPAEIAPGICLFVLATHRSSTGQILWFDTLMVLHVLLLGVAAMLSTRLQPRLVAGWTLRLGGLITVITYVLAGVAKLRIGGTAWVGDGALERHIAWSATRAEVMGGTPSPLAGPLVNLGVASAPLAIAVLVLELAAPIALLNRRAAVIWSAATWAMHLGIALTMFVLFHWPLLGPAFVPLLLVHSRAGTKDSASAARRGED